MRLDEDEDTCVLHRIAGIGSYDAMNYSTGNKSKHKVAGLLSRPGHDCGIEFVVLVIKGRTIAALRRCELIFGGRQICEREFSFAV